MKRLVSLFVLSMLLFAAVITVASAGGWAVVTLDAMPQNVVVNEPLHVGMMIRQHGKTPWVYNDVRVRGYHSTGETFVVPAKMDTEGHYNATLEFEKEGTWQWAVSSGLLPDWQPMPEIQVASSAKDEVLLAEANAANAVAPPAQLSGSNMLLLALGIVGLAGSGAGLVLWWRSRR
jgi:hypothetical protein